LALLYTDEGFPLQASRLLREMGHDVLTVQEAGKANQRIPDETIAEPLSKKLIRVNRPNP